MDKNFHVFVSHSSKDKKLAKSLCKYLEERKINCWIAPRDLDEDAGISYKEGIIKGIKASPVMLVILTKDAMASDDVTNEVDFAFKLKKHVSFYKTDDTPLTDAMTYTIGSRHYFQKEEEKTHEEYFGTVHKNCLKFLGMDGLVTDKETDKIVSPDKPTGNDLGKIAEQEKALSSKPKPIVGTLPPRIYEPKRYTPPLPQQPFTGKPANTRPKVYYEEKWYEREVLGDWTIINIGVAVLFASPLVWFIWSKKYLDLKPKKTGDHYVFYDLLRQYEFVFIIALIPLVWALFTQEKESWRFALVVALLAAGLGFYCWHLGH